MTRSDIARFASNPIFSQRPFTASVICDICGNGDSDFGFDVLVDEGQHQIVECRNCEATMVVEWRRRKAKVIGLPYPEGQIPDGDAMLATNVAFRKDEKLALGAKLRRTPHPGPSRRPLNAPRPRAAGGWKLVAYGLNSVLAFFLMHVAAAAMVIVVGDAVIELWADERQVLAIVALVGFPLTFIIWPWMHEVFGGFPLWAIAIAGFLALKMASYWVERAAPEARRDRDRFG